MKLLTRIRTWKDRLKVRLIEDELHDMDRMMVHAVGPAWLVLADNRHALESTQLRCEERLDAAGVPVDAFAMGNLEITASVAAVVAVLVYVLAVLMAVVP